MAQSNPFRFSTKYQDQETGLLYYGYRYYQPGTGRWLSRDPLGDHAFFSRYTFGMNPDEAQRLHRQSLSPLYGFVHNSALNFIDSLGLAYFAYRPLSGVGGLLGVSTSPWDDEHNTVVGHEQLFFEDGLSPTNIGFFSDGTLKSDSATNFQSPHDKGYEDCVMRMAVARVKLKPYCLLGKPGSTEKNNCQDWADAVRAEYKRLMTEMSNP